MNIMPLINLSLSGDLPPEQLKQIAVTQIVPELTKVDGVLRVDTEGGDKDQVVITPDPDKMTRYGVSMAQIAGLLGTSYSSLSDVENTSLGIDSVKLSDVATVSKSPPPLSAITRTNGHPSVGISVAKTESAIPWKPPNAVNAKVAELEGKLGNGVTISTIFDQSDFIKASINQLWEKAIIGAVLAILVVFLFLWAVRASLITAISIPLSVFIGFLCMRLTGVTLNLLTLSAMTIAVGRLIDDSIVMVEVIFRRIRRGESFKEAAIGGAKEIANSDYHRHAGYRSYLHTIDVRRRHRGRDVHPLCPDSNFRHAGITTGGIDADSSPIPISRQCQTKINYDKGQLVPENLCQSAKMDARTPCYRGGDCHRAADRQYGAPFDNRHFFHVRLDGRSDHHHQYRPAGECGN